MRYSDMSAALEKAVVDHKAFVSLSKAYSDNFDDSHAFEMPQRVQQDVFVVVRCFDLGASFKRPLIITERL